MKESRATTPEPIAVYSSYRRRAPREIDSRHGGKSLTGAGRHGSKARNGKEERGLERILGRGLGRGFNLGAMHDVKGKRGRMQGEPDKEKEKPPKQEGLELDGNQAEVMGMKLACKLASSRRNIKCAVDKLKANFWAPSSKASREVKRGEGGVACEIAVWRRWTSVSLVAGRCGRSSSLHQGRQHEVRRSILE